LVSSRDMGSSVGTSWEQARSSSKNRLASRSRTPAFTLLYRRPTRRMPREPAMANRVRMLRGGRPDVLRLTRGPGDGRAMANCGKRSGHQLGEARVVAEARVQLRAIEGGLGPCADAPRTD